MVLFFISQDPLSLQNLKIEEISTNRKRGCLSVMQQKKRKSNVFECSASPTPRDPKRMVFSHDFCIGICAYLVGREGEISGESRGSSGDWI